MTNQYRPQSWNPPAAPPPLRPPKRSSAGWVVALIAAVVVSGVAGGITGTVLAGTTTTPLEREIADGRLAFAAAEELKAPDSWVRLSVRGTEAVSTLAVIEAIPSPLEGEGEPDFDELADWLRAINVDMDVEEVAACFDDEQQCTETANYTGADGVEFSVGVEMSGDTWIGHPLLRVSVEVA